MKLKNKKGTDCYPEYEGSGWYVEGAENLADAAKHLNDEYLCEDQVVYTAEDGRVAHLHRCLDCDMEWEHDGDYCCGECGEYRLSRKYKELYFFKK